MLKCDINLNDINSDDSDLFCDMKLTKAHESIPVVIVNPHDESNNDLKLGYIYNKPDREPRMFTDENVLEQTISSERNDLLS